MPDISATEAVRSFSDVLDGVEHARETYTIIRRGKAVAHLEPIDKGGGAEVKEILSRHSPDSSWGKSSRVSEN